MSVLRSHYESFRERVGGEGGGGARGQTGGGRRGGHTKGERAKEHLRPTLWCRSNRAPEPSRAQRAQRGARSHSAIGNVKRGRDKPAQRAAIAGANLIERYSWRAGARHHFVASTRRELDREEARARRNDLGKSRTARATGSASAAFLGLGLPGLDTRDLVGSAGSCWRWPATVASQAPAATVTALALKRTLASQVERVKNRPPVVR